MPNLIRVMTKAHRHLGKDYPPKATDYQVEFAGKTGITVYRDDANGTPIKGTSFRVGDICEEDSYNLSYHATILKITDNTITVKTRIGNKIKRMSLDKFCWRNHKFDLGRSNQENSEEMMYL